jgi:hypothetical protein
MAGRQSKPIQLVKGHRTKKEIEIRKKAEESLLSGSSYKEWADVKNNPIAHKEFIRLRKAFKAIGKDDSLHENTINRFCLLHAECKEFEVLKDKLLKDFEQLEEGNYDMEFTEYLRNKTELYKQLMACDKKVMDKRKMMLDIEKENIMTIASALRSIPKKPVEKQEEDPMAAFLRG